MTRWVSYKGGRELEQYCGAKTIDGKRSKKTTKKRDKRDKRDKKTKKDRKKKKKRKKRKKKKEKRSVTKTIVKKTNKRCWVVPSVAIVETKTAPGPISYRRTPLYQVATFPEI